MILISASVCSGISTVNKNAVIKTTKITASNADLLIIITNISIVDGDNGSGFQINFTIVNTLNQTITIVTPDTCTPFRAHFFVFQTGGNYISEKGLYPYVCGQLVSSHYYKPGLENESSFFKLDGLTIPNGDYYTEMFIAGDVSPYNYSLNTVQFTVDNNKISNFSNYISRKNLFVDAYAQILKLSLDSSPQLPRISLAPNYLEFSILFSIITPNNTAIYPRSIAEQPNIYLQLKNLDLNWTFNCDFTQYQGNSTDNIYAPANYSAIFPFELNSTLYNKYNITSIPNGHYLVKLYDSTGLIPNNNTNLVTFTLNNKTISDEHIENLNLPFVTLSNSAYSTKSNLSSITTGGFTIIFPMAIMIFLSLTVKFGTKKKN